MNKALLLLRGGGGSHIHWRTSSGEQIPELTCKHTRTHNAVHSLCVNVCVRVCVSSVCRNIVDAPVFALFPVCLQVELLTFLTGD